ncbi:phage holin family protein [Sporichthya sp.]|uniref:phage holin family protein n=1 Tax=Sporichthya sp. TaxID=65475 RepID=UPI00181E7207|nr:phage holin family protein [Sporichthya sp.]MBA3744031.1 phage holin family protein [Sporichthya sp.]
MAEHRNGSASTAEAPSLGELVAAASQNASILIRSEIELAKTELAAEAKKAAVGGGMFGAAGLLGFFGFIFLSFGAVYGLDKTSLDLWACFLIVAGAYLLVAGILVVIGVKSLKKIGPPKRTQRTIKDTVATLKTRGKKQSASA